MVECTYNFRFLIKFIFFNFSSVNLPYIKKVLLIGELALEVVLKIASGPGWLSC